MMRMPQINLKFSPEMEELIIHGKKCCTTRIEQKGHVGDTFTVRDRIYRIVSVINDEFDYIEPYYQLEGFETPEEFIEILTSYYPTLVSGDVVFMHWFAYVGDVV